MSNGIRKIPMWFLVFVGIVFAVMFVWCLIHVFNPKTARAGTFEYSKTIYTNEGLPAQGAIVKLYRGIYGSLYATDTCDASGVFLFPAVSDSFALYRVEVTNWDPNAPWRPMEWTFESVIAGTISYTDTTFVHLEGDTLIVLDVFTATKGRFTDSLHVAILHTDDLRVQSKANIPGIHRSWQKVSSTQSCFGGMLSLRFDDGVVAPDNYMNIADSLESRGLRGSFPIHVRLIGQGTVGGKTYMTKAQVLELHNRGHEFLDHVADGTAMAGKTPAQWEALIKEGRDSLRAWGITPKVWVAHWDWAWSDTFEAIVKLYYPYASMGQSAKKSAMLPKIGNTYFGVPSDKQQRVSKWNIPTVAAGTGATPEHTLGDLRTLLANARAQNRWLDMYWHMETQARIDRLMSVIDYADSIGIPVLTLGDAAAQWYTIQRVDNRNIFTNYNCDDLDGDNIADGGWGLYRFAIQGPAATTNAIAASAYPATGGMYASGVQTKKKYALSLWVQKKSTEHVGAWVTKVEVAGWKHTGPDGALTTTVTSGWGNIVITPDSTTGVWTLIDRTRDPRMVLTVPDSTEFLAIIFASNNSADTVLACGFSAIPLDDGSEDVKRGPFIGWYPEPPPLGTMFTSADYDTLYIRVGPVLNPTWKAILTE